MTREMRHLGELTRRMRGELRLVGELREALARQRAGIVNDDHDAMLATARDVGGIVHELEEARQDRVLLVGAITGDEGFPLARLEERMDGPLPDAFLRARDALRDAGRRAAADVLACRAVARRALEATRRRPPRPIAGFGDLAGPSVS